MPRDDEFTLMDASAPKHVTLTPEQESRRLMLIGDVHGCCDELRQLIREYGKQHDIIIFVGDLVNKGPKSVEVVRLARELNALAVVGNHELASLRGYHLRTVDKASALSYQWTDGLSTEDITYLSRLPYTISIPAHNAVVVHAGLVPGIALTQQKSRDMVSMRNVRKVGAEWQGNETEEEGGAWAREWKGPQHVYFGHDAKRRLQQENFATGLDTGCLYGGELTAALLHPDGATKFVSVKSHRVYVQPGGRTVTGTMAGVHTPVPSARRNSVFVPVVCLCAVATLWLRWRRNNKS